MKKRTENLIKILTQQLKQLRDMRTDMVKIEEDLQIAVIELKILKHEIENPLSLF